MALFLILIAKVDAGVLDLLDGLLTSVDGVVRDLVAWVDGGNVDLGRVVGFDFIEGIVVLVNAGFVGLLVLIAKVVGGIIVVLLDGLEGLALDGIEVRILVA